MSQLEHNISNAVTEPYLRLHDNEAVVHLPHNDDTNAKEAPLPTLSGGMHFMAEFVIQICIDGLTPIVFCIGRG